MRFHVASLPHTQTVRAYSNCAYTEKVRKFCGMMKSLGHQVILYASEENEADCDDLVTCITKQEQADLLDVHGPEDVLKAPFERDAPHWELMNKRAIAEIRKRANPHDFICLIAGGCQEPIVDAFPSMISVEFGVGYEGILFQPQGLRVFESYAWMQTMYGRWLGAASSAQGFFYDRVIPNYFEPEQFIYREKKHDYFLYLGRVNEDKGVGIAAAAAKELGARLVVAGQGSSIPHGADYRGLVGPKERAELLAGARATFVPSLYLEPFGGVAVESLLSGTPIITTDWGAFPEINDHGVTGFRCRTLADFVDAARKVDDIDPLACRARGMRYSTYNVRHEYQRYFEDLDGLWTDGWYNLPTPRREVTKLWQPTLPKSYASQPLSLPQQ